MRSDVTTNVSSFRCLKESQSDHLTCQSGTSSLEHLGGVRNIRRLRLRQLDHHVLIHGLRIIRRLFEPAPVLVHGETRPIKIPWTAGLPDSRRRNLHVRSSHHHQSQDRHQLVRLADRHVAVELLRRVDHPCGQAKLADAFDGSSGLLMPYVLCNDCLCYHEITQITRPTSTPEYRRGCLFA